ncbi:K(+)-transporting ATPase subunit C [Paraburkholderia hospita]|uniref:K(+)-transporting ATPase subunit C n=1 Tax=Paraburkholderia hospita TaxID=169430 RepID=UPI000B3446F9|nr:K(+)-transporting ATPase subunit C [Paraburkholderia hospita]OUL96522.1 potassium-transporting ATPase subunit C [Paraburkholderia hospita]
MSTFEHARTASSAAPLTRGLARPALVSAVLFMVVAGLGYPLLTTGLAQLLFHKQAGGSLVEHHGVVIGSSLIGQNFTQPGYFHPRPSATSAPDPKDASQTVSSPYNAALSGASNLGPSSKKLIDQVRDRILAYRKENGLADDAQIPVDAVTASASGLDPDISLANASLQAPRIARARGLSEHQVRTLINEQSSPRQLGVLGDPRANVLALNLALDALVPQPSSTK